MCTMYKIAVLYSFLVFKEHHMTELRWRDVKALYSAKNQSVSQSVKSFFLNFKIRASNLVCVCGVGGGESRF